MNTKTIIWDIDGVLIWHHPDDPNCDWRRALADNNLLGVWEAFQHSPEWELCIRNHEIDTRERFNHFLQNKGIALRHDIDDVIHIWLEKNIEPSLPALNRLYELREKGAECVVASNQDALRKPHIEHWLTRYGLDDLPCFISCDLKAAKPDPLFYVQVQESLGKQPEDQ
ncbi:MAG: HAD family hydrolase, partial [Alphaproteobacteria bacterium]